MTGAAESRRLLAAAWLARLLAREPDAATLAATPAAARLLLVGPAGAALAAAAAGDPERIAADYARLFHGVGPRAVHACESSYGLGDGLLFEAARAEMAETLEALGLAPVKHEFREPEDHVSVELEAWASALERGKEALATALEARLRRWVPRFARGLEREAREPWLKAIAAALDEVLA